MSHKRWKIAERGTPPPSLDRQDQQAIRPNRDLTTSVFTNIFKEEKKRAEKDKVNTSLACAKTAEMLISSAKAGEQEREAVAKIVENCRNKTKRSEVND